MKILSTIGLVVLVFLFHVSCTGNKTNVGELIGTWTLSSEEAIACAYSPDNYQEVIPCSDSTCFKITFARHGKVKISVTMGGHTNSWVQTYKVNGNNISLCDSTGCKSHGSFIINDSELTLADSTDNGCLKREYYKKLRAVTEPLE